MSKSPDQLLLVHHANQHDLLVLAVQILDIRPTTFLISAPNATIAMDQISLVWLFELRSQMAMPGAALYRITGYNRKSRNRVLHECWWD
ncbi:hypothetical protein C8J56DRAFT_1062388 [Mycena floridula]|nr:hypothetical protein C8J56DRAFT_1062388 [Mycena floridula]